MFTTSFAAPDRFLSTLPVRGATGSWATSWPACWISIHAPREGSDYRTAVYNTTAELFLSTLPVRGATGQDAAETTGHGDFYPRSP